MERKEGVIRKIEDIGELVKKLDPELAKKVYSLRIEVDDLCDKYEDLTETDGLTELKNPRGFGNALNIEISRANRLNHNVESHEELNYIFSLFMIDLNKFKKLNDNYGHNAGDYFLKLFANIMKQRIKREEDTIARVGGDEFSAILVYEKTIGETKPIKEFKEGIKNIAESLVYSFYDNANSRLVMMEPLPGKNPVEDLSLSLGMTFFPRPSKTLFEVKQDADKAMYQAKDAFKESLLKGEKSRGEIVIYTP